jgi:hypothetical protein
MQGFFVHVKAAGTSINLPVESKTPSIAAPLRSKGFDRVKKIKLVLNNGLVPPDETIVCLIDKATLDFDGDYDAYKLFGSGTATPFIYTELKAIKYAINAVHEPDSGSVIIPVTIEIKTPGTYKIDITEFENLEGYRVVLKHGSIETVLFKNASYQFTSESGIFTNLQLVINKATTGIDNHPENKIKTWYSNNILFIDCPSEISANRASLIIYDISGKIVFNNHFQIIPGQSISVPLSLPSGLFITLMILNNMKYVSKFVVY